MARKLRVQYEGAIYHVTIRGVNRRRIFDDDADRERFLLRLSEAVEECGVRLYLFALMKNHAHLLAETPQANLSVFMHKLQTAYTVYYNLRHRRSGHLMQGRFGAVLVQGDEYLLNLSRYVHLNPVFVRGKRRLPLEQRLKELHAYHWSSYGGYAGLKRPRGFVTEGPILAMMNVPPKRERTAYRRFVEAGLAVTDEAFVSAMKASQWGIGDEAFRDHVRDLHTEMASAVRRPEDVSFCTMKPLRAPGDVLVNVAKAFDIPVEALRRRQYGCVARSVAALMLGKHSGMSQRDIGIYLSMGTGSAVCRQLQQLRNKASHTPDLVTKMTALSEALSHKEEDRA